MNKKVKSVLKDYEKNMKFNNQFSELKMKLNLIDDTKKDVIVIRRRLIPAYMMSVLVLALMTGLIGLQIGLSNLKIKTEYINPVELELYKIVNVYSEHPVYTTAISSDSIVIIYYGLKDDKEYLIFRYITPTVLGNFQIDYNGESFVEYLSNSSYKEVEIEGDNQYIEIVFRYVDPNLNEISKTFNFDLGSYKAFFQSQAS